MRPHSGPYCQLMTFPLPVSPTVRTFMNRFLGVMLVSAMVCVPSNSARADDAKVAEVLDKAVAALGGKDKLAKADAATWKAKAKITIEGNENEMTLEGTVQGIDHYRAEFEG